MAQRISGRKGRMYVALTNGGEAVPVMFMRTWSLNASTPRSDVTAQGDENMVYTSELPDAQGDYNGFLDVDAPQFYAAARDGLARKFYLYPSTTSATTYWHGTALFDFQTSVPVDGPATVSGSWSATSPVPLVQP